ncbi:MAG: AAA family ATPase [bacterium]|nr:AAA family ATPase [bacterium]
MADFSITRWAKHPYLGKSRAHEHFLPTPVELPAFSAGAVPFRWMLRENAAEIANSLDIVFHEEAEDRARELMGFNSQWLQDVGNQTRMLDSFFSAIEPERSLAFFYAKQVPHTERPGRVLIGVGWVESLGQALEHEYKSGVDASIRSMVWERTVHHSIRSGKVDGGFLLPYHAALERAEDDPSFNPEDVVAFAPDEAFEQFSYASEHVTHDHAIASLFAIIEGLQRARSSLGISFDDEVRWAQDRLGELWELRGAFPGLGSALAAFGIDHANLLAYRILDGLSGFEDPWPAVQAALEDPAGIGPEWVGRVGPTIAKKLAGLSDERRSLLHLLARFDLTPDQAKRFYLPEEREKAGITVSDSDLLENPFLLYETDRFSPDATPVTVIDRGLHPPQTGKLSTPIPEPSAMIEVQDPRRVRALMVSELEKAADIGHTLFPRDELITAIRSMPVNPPCLVDGDLLDVIEGELQPAIQVAHFHADRPGFQLERLSDARTLISNEVTRRVATKKRHDIQADWKSILDGLLEGPATADEAEARAREEKAAALEELAAARFAVLVGAAGTGKTTLLRALCTHPQIQKAGVTLLAPTGKARVQLERGLSRFADVRARTIAQFLVQSGRYNPLTSRYCRSSDPPAITGGTLIIDEASMITEEQLVAVLDNVSQVERLILVGDPRQLPPIGAGRPFVDIVELLREGAHAEFPRIGPSYAELTIHRRQLPGADQAEFRHDLALAQWFGGDAPSSLAEEAWGEVLSGSPSETLRFEKWDSPTEVFERLQKLLVEEIPDIAGIDDQAGFGVSLGGVPSNGNVYFNPSYPDKPGAGAASEEWQILSPVHATAAGVAELNRSIHRHFRADLVTLARDVPRFGRKVPKPMGPEGIVYGDKVMNVRNHRHRDLHPEEFPEGSPFADPAKFVANGEIGMVVGQFKKRGQTFKVTKLEVEFSTQQGVKYKFGNRYLPNDGNEPYLELAYAITIHKSQGSEFKTSFLVIPYPCPLLSRELLYTALTRQENRVVVLHQGSLAELLSYSSAEHSETARRYTNLFRDPQPQAVGDGRYLEANLIHRTSNGTFVRSKSEVIIADALSAASVEFAYEREFQGHDGTIRLPDFTIEDAATGETYIWEHLGMLSDPQYAQAWERKKSWYAASGVKESGGDAATLIVTRDDERGGIDSAEVQARVREIA